MEGGAPPPPFPPPSTDFLLLRRAPPPLQLAKKGASPSIQLLGQIGLFWYDHEIRFARDERDSERAKKASTFKKEIVAMMQKAEGCAA